MPPIYSDRFGGAPPYGDAVTEPGIDCIITLGPDPYIIRRIRAAYIMAGDRITGVTDYSGGFRSFSGRLIVIEGEIDRSLSPVVPPNLLLTNQLPPEIKRRVLFDTLINEYTPDDYVFGEGDIGAVANTQGKISIILFAGEQFTNPGGVRIYNTAQFLHVTANKLPANTGVSLGGGKLRTVN